MPPPPPPPPLPPLTVLVTADSAATVAALSDGLSTIVDVFATATADSTTVATTDSAATVATVIDGLLIIAGIATAADPWSLNTNGSVCMPAAREMAKSWEVKLAIIVILCAGSIDEQAALSELLLIILPCPLHANSQGSACPRSRQRKKM